MRSLRPVPHHRFHASFLTLAAALAIVVSPAVTNAQTDTNAALVKQIDSIVQDAFSADLPGAAVIAMKGGQQVYRSARGKADLEFDIPLSPDMVFRIGSVTKQFTAASIMMLVQEGKVAIDDPITKFLPKYPTQETTITVRHLLEHTSGIRSYTDMPGWMQSKIQHDMSVRKLISGFKNEPMDFQPGAEFRYNNSGYILLGAIIEKASGKSYEQFIQEHIFTPLEMNHSYYGDHENIISNRASGYDGSKDQPENAKYLSMTQPFAAGSLLSTVSDLSKWNAALFSGKVVSTESLEQMTTVGTLNGGEKTQFGFGLMVGDVRGHKSISHGGGIFGFACQSTYLPDDDVYVAVLCNSTFANPGEVATKIAAAVVGDPFPEFKAVELPEETLQQYVGVYKIDEEARRIVTFKDGQLFTQRTGGGRMAITPYSETGFFYESNPSFLEFVLEGDQVTGMEMHQNGSKASKPAVRIEEEMPDPPKIAEIDFAIYDD